MTQCKDYKLTIKIEGEGFVRVDGGVPIRKKGALTFTLAEWHELRAMPAKGHGFNYWEESGLITWFNNPRKIFLNCDSSITALFSECYPGPQPEPPKCEARYQITNSFHSLPCQRKEGAGHEGQHQHTIKW